MVKIGLRNHIDDKPIKLIVENKGLNFVLAGDKVLKIFFSIDESLVFFQLASPLSPINRRFKNGDEEK